MITVKKHGRTTSKVHEKQNRVNLGTLMEKMSQKIFFLENRKTSSFKQIVSSK